MPKRPKGRPLAGGSASADDGKPNNFKKAGRYEKEKHQLRLTQRTWN